MLYSGTFTIKNPMTPNYRTFLIKKAQDELAPFMPGKRLVGLLTGPDNYHDFQLFGYVDEDSQCVIVFKKHTGTAETPSKYDWYARMLNVIVSKTVKDPRFTTYQVSESRSCYRCGRKLTTPESIEAGIGPECAKR